MALAGEGEMEGAPSARMASSTALSLCIEEEDVEGERDGEGEGDRPAALCRSARRRATVICADAAFAKRVRRPE